MPRHMQTHKREICLHKHTTSTYDTGYANRDGYNDNTASGAASRHDP